jgi:RecB family endonuclease NucS
MVRAMGRKIIVTSPTGQLPVLEEVKAHDEAQLQELLKAHPGLLPLEDLGLAAPAIVVGRESVLDSGRIDLVLLANGGELVLVEFKTGPQNPDFRECLAQLLDYGSDLWGMTLEDFDTRVARRYFSGPHFPQDGLPAPLSLEAAATTA